MTKPGEIQHLDFVDGWVFERKYSCVGIAKFVKSKERAWGEWFISSEVSGVDAWKFEHAKLVHGPSPTNKFEPPRQISIPPGVK